jgi:hypothetical protein
MITLVVDLGRKEGLDAYLAAVPALAVGLPGFGYVDLIENLVSLFPLCMHFECPI